MKQFASIARLVDNTGRLTLEGRQWAESVEDFVRPEDFTGTSLYGALLTGISENVPVWLAGSYALTDELADISLSSQLEVHGGGKIVVPSGMTNGLTFIAAWDDPVDVSAISYTTRTFPDASTASTATKITAAGHGAVIGSLIKIVAEDAVPADDPGHRIGEFRYVADVSGNDIYVAGALYNTYTTDPRLQVVPREPRLIWDGPGFYTDPNATPWSCIYMQVRGFIQPFVRTRIENQFGIGINVQSCFQARIEFQGVQALNQIDSEGIEGRGIQDQCSEQTTWRADGIDYRHIYTSVGATPAGDGDPTWKYGQTKGSFGDGGTAMGCSAAAYDVHQGSVGCTIRGVVVSETRFGESASASAVQLRGQNNRFIDVTDRGSQVCLNFHPAVADDVTDCEAKDAYYDSDGSYWRVANSSETLVTTRPRVIGGTAATTKDRFGGLWRCSDGLNDGTLYRVRSSATTAWVYNIGHGTTCRFRNITIDLAGFGGTNFDFLLFDTGVTDTPSVVVENLTVINGTLRSIVNANSQVGSVEIWGFRGNEPTGGWIRNGGSLTSIKRSQDTAAPTTGTWKRGDVVWNLTPSAAGAPGWICVTAGTPGTWKAMANVAA